MNYTPTTQQLEQRGLFRELLGDLRNAAQLVHQQPNLTRRQRDSVAVLLAISGRVVAEFSDEPRPTVFERLLAAMEE